MPAYPMFMSKLSPDDRAHIKACITMLSHYLAVLSARLRGYEADTAEVEAQSVIKLLNDLKETRVMINEMENELIAKHQVPIDLKHLIKHVDVEFREVFREILTLKTKPE